MDMDTGWAESEWAVVGEMAYEVRLEVLGDGSSNRLLAPSSFPPAGPVDLVMPPDQYFSPWFAAAFARGGFAARFVPGSALDGVRGRTRLRLEDCLMTRIEREHGPHLSRPCDLSVYPQGLLAGAAELPPEEPARVISRRGPAV